jgi:hypothetical protein
MALVLRNKQLLTLIIVALITVAIISFLVLGMVSHFSFFPHPTADGWPL